jgi:hypothetical protein
MVGHVTDVLPEPGDLAVVNTLTTVSAIVELMERLASPSFSQWNHVVVCTRIDYPKRMPSGRGLSADSPVIWVAEAQPGGAVEVPWSYGNVPHVWSTGVLPTSQVVAAAAVRYTRPGPWGNHGVPYSFLDYGAIAAHHAHVPVPGLRSYIETTHHMQCAYFADRCKLDGGVHLYSDDRWPGDVMPSDIGALLPAWEGAHP